jgi:hypothetical protein
VFYPVVYALEYLYYQTKQDITRMKETKKNNNPSKDSALLLIHIEQCHTLELIAMLEQVFNYGQIENVKVIAYCFID